jgi:hypothetical protein
MPFALLVESQCPVIMAPVWKERPITIQGKEQKFKDQMTADEACLAVYKVNLQKRVSGEPDACQDKSLPKAEDLDEDASSRKPDAL